MRLTDMARKGTGKQEKACASWEWNVEQNTYATNGQAAQLQRHVPTRSDGPPGPTL